jgi:hypothetical protein
MPLQSSYGHIGGNQDAQSEEIEAALKIILPKPYTGAHHSTRAVIAH